MFNNPGIEFYEEIINAANKGLQEIKEKKQFDATHKKDLFTVISESLDKIDFGKNVFNPFDKDKFNDKMKVDLMLYEQLLDKLPLEQTEMVDKLLTEMYKVIKEVYELANIEPETFRNLIQKGVLEESIENRNKVLKEAIFEHLDNIFYSLSPEQRKKKYLTECTEIVKDFITKHNINITEATDLAVKTKLFEQLITKIAFPGAIYSRINYLTESETYKSVFDAEYLAECLEKFHKYALVFSEVLATIN